MDYIGTHTGTDDARDLTETVKENAYTPFTEFDEGALFITDAGDGVIGARVENSNYTNTRHAVETALGDLLSVDSDPAYLVVSTDDAADRSSFLQSQPQQLYEFVDGNFPVVVHDAATGQAQQYSVDELVHAANTDYTPQGETPDDIGTFTVESPYTEIMADDAVDRIAAWRDAAYDELENRLSAIDMNSDDPMDDVMREATDAFMTVDEKPEDVLAELHGYADDAQQNAHEPYSSYPVGVALLDRDGRVFSGQNMEDDDISYTMHGEGNAFTTAVTWGLERGDPVFLDVHTEGETPPFPCGLCRQTAAEFADDDMVIGAIGKDGSDVEAYSTLGWHLQDMFRL